MSRTQQQQVGLACSTGGVYKAAPSFAKDLNIRLSGGSYGIKVTALTVGPIGGHFGDESCLKGFCAALFDCAVG